MASITSGTVFFEACQRGHVTNGKDLRKHVDQSSFKESRTLEGRTCLHVAVLAGDLDLLRELAATLKELIKEEDNQGDTALHLAVRLYRLDLVKPLLELDSEGDLCDCKNKNGETPLNMAIRLQFLEAVELLITKSALEEENNFLFHWLVGLNQIKLVKFLIRFSEDNKVDLSKIMNQPYKPATNPSDKEGNPQPNKPATNPSDKEGNPQHIEAIVEGDMPLHIAARNKYEQTVKLLLSVDMVDKHACNSKGKTPLDIAREVTEYYESFRIIKSLRNDPPRRKPFMYCAPQVSHEKYKNAMEMVTKAFEERRNSELVVAALLATMTFTAAFTVPGGFQTETQQFDELGSPILIPFTSFKLFLVFDCIAFFLSLFACIMWQLASELTTRDKMVFMTVNGLVVCLSFGFTAYGFMAALYTVLVHKVKTFAWVVLGNLIFISACGFFAFIYQSARFAVARARLGRLCGKPRLMDDFVIWVWEISERFGLLDHLRSWVAGIRDTFSGQPNTPGNWMPGKLTDLFSAGNCRLSAKKGEHSCNYSCSSSPCPLNRGIAQP